MWYGYCMLKRRELSGSSLGERDCVRLGTRTVVRADLWLVHSEWNCKYIFFFFRTTSFPVSPRKPCFCKGLLYAALCHPVLSMLLLMQPRMPLAFLPTRAYRWLMFSFMSSRALWTFPAGQSPAGTGAWVVSSQWTWAWCLLSLNCTGFLLAHLASLPRSLWRAAQHSSQLCRVCKLAYQFTSLSWWTSCH